MKKAHNSNHGTRWWIKADACDLRKGLRESVKGKWAGDEDLGDGVMERLEAEYDLRKEFSRSLGVGARAGNIVEDLNLLLFGIAQDIDVLKNGEKKANELYEKHRRGSNTSESMLMALAWDLVGYEQLLRDADQLTAKCNTIIHGATSQVFNNGNFKGDLTQLHVDMKNYLKQLFSKKRVAATHLMVFMIADESRNLKPYALSVRVLPYASMTDARLRELEEELRTAMVNLGMVVVGQHTIYHWYHPTSELMQILHFNWLSWSSKIQHFFSVLFPKKILFNLHLL